MPTKVIIIGGGVAGMSAAHELIERGFEVVVLERREIAGGKARSVPVIDDGVGTSGHELADTGASSIEHHLPGEHGFRFFPGFYKHVIDTMSRTPSFDGRSVADHLVPTTRMEITQYGKPPILTPTAFPRASDAGTVLRDILLAFGPITGLTPDDIAIFGARVWQILTSCAERRLGEYEGTGWWEFVDAAQRSASYQKFLAIGFTRSLVAAKAKKASTRTIGDVFVALMLTILNPAAGSTDRVIDGPTNLVWIDPWRTYLESRGVRYVRCAEVEEILCENGRISGVVVRQQGRRTVEKGDQYVVALPLDRISQMLNEPLLAADPALRNLGVLAENLEWMNGLQFYLRRGLPLTHGHVIHVDTDWALTSVSQLQFWRGVRKEIFGHSGVLGVLSVDISDWTAPGSDGRPAMQCPRREVMRETWNQLKRSINFDEEVLRDKDLHSWFLDRDIKKDPDRPGFLHNVEPLLVNLVNTWALRPEATTAIPNLFLASDYVRTNTDLATMEGANEAARRAVNGLLDVVGYEGPRCDLWSLYEPEILAPWRLYDAARYKAGLPWDDTLMQVAAHAIRAASPILQEVGPLLESVTPFVGPIADALDATDGVLEPADDGQTVALVELQRTSQTPAFGGATEPSAVTQGLEKDVGPAGFQERLAWYRDMLADTLAAGVPTWEPQRYLYRLVRDFLDRAGKGLRPALCVATARALGGRAENAYPAAAGIEMLHNAFLVHDDIEDESHWRRGAATMHRSAGVPIAVNAGDAMNALAMRLFHKAGDRLGPVAALRIFDEVDHLLVETLEGQATELGWIKDNDLTLRADDYLRLVLKKTAWYSFIHPLRIGALIADTDDQRLDRFDRYGYLLGVAFQITDDVLNLSGSFRHYGKEIDGDLWEGKRTLVLTHALGGASHADRSWMTAFLARPRERRLPREVFRLNQIIAAAGSIQWAQRVAAVFAEAAAREFDSSAFAGAPASPDLEWLRGCIAFLTQRDA
jgi:geranylgeranyl pyrophosphate synthase/uncharacterized protein with NAD-binding domain and iron-sulfur cluster